MAKLTALKVKNAKPGRHGDGGGLHLLVSPKGSKSWVLRTIVEEHGGKRRRDIGLGSCELVSLEEAREKARALRKVAREGGSPTAVRDHREEIAPSFAEAARQCHAALAPGWSERHAGAFLSTLDLHVFPKIGAMPVDTVGENDILAVLSPLWTTKPSAARKLRQRIGTVLDYSKGRGWRSIGSPRDGLRPLLSRQPKAGNFASMPYSEVPAFFTDQSGKTESVGRMALLFTILTGARSGETRSAMWSHIDEDAKLWHRPADLMKSGVAHTITLSPGALAILKRARALRTTAKDALIFPGRGGQLSDMTLGKIVKPTAYTVHGFRSSFRTWAAEQMPTIPETVAEAALSHAIPDQVVRSYNRAKFLEMRRALLDGWGAYVEGQSNVLRLVG